MVEKKGEGLPAILQPFDVCDKPASLDRKREPFRCAFIPTSKNLFLGQAIKRDVQFDGVKMFGIEFEPLSLGKIRWVEDTIPPMGVIVAAGTDEDHKPRVQRLVRVTVTRPVSSNGNGYVKYRRRKRV